MSSCPTITVTFMEWGNVAICQEYGKGDRLVSPLGYRIYLKALLKKATRRDVEKNRQFLYLTNCKFTFSIDNI